jgi:FtsP/CotA-like multicopper oxidase with cupredoxin domain
MRATVCADRPGAAGKFVRRRDPDAVSTFVYHCHPLEHEDRGMMGTIRVLPNKGLMRDGEE